MQAWDSIQDTLIWIEENLPGRIEIGELAARAHLSPFYYQRLFCRLTGKPVMEYVKLRRLSGAAAHLANNKAKVIDTAFDFGFENPETFTRSFKDAYGMTPEEYRGAPRPLSHFLMPDLSLKYRLIDDGVPLAADGIVLEVRRETLKTPRMYAGLSVQNPVSDTPGIDLLSELWTRFHHRKPQMQDIVPKGTEAGASFAGEEENCFTYFAGAEVSAATPQTDLRMWTMPAGAYAVCAFEAEDFASLTANALNKARDYMLGTWLPGHGMTCEPFMAELYADTAAEASAMEIWLKTISLEAAAG